MLVEAEIAVGIAVGSGHLRRLAAVVAADDGLAVEQQASELAACEAVARLLSSVAGCFLLLVLGHLPAAAWPFAAELLRAVDCARYVSLRIADYTIFYDLPDVEPGREPEPELGLAVVLYCVGLVVERPAAAVVNAEAD